MDEQMVHTQQDTSVCPICNRQLTRNESAQFKDEGKFHCEDCGATVAPSTHSQQHGESHDGGCGCGGSCGCGGH